jgi:ADP-ribose pyrophosphatase YjhB (NUDIX family)
MPYFWIEAAKKLQAIAQTGLFYSTNQYDRERFEQVESISNELISHYSNLSPEIIKILFSGDNGYITPKVDVRAVILRNNQLLMVKEKADGKWSVPGGWADIGYTPYEIAVKETFEEAGLVVKPIRLLAVMDKKCHPHPPTPFYSYKIFILCEIISGEIKSGNEILDAKFFDLNDIPELSIERLTTDQIQIIVERFNNPELPVYCE